jgi:hypothetical protein
MMYCSVDDAYTNPMQKKNINNRCFSPLVEEKKDFFFNQQNLMGTSISDLHKKEILNQLQKVPDKFKRSHKYYINTFVESVISDNSDGDNGSSSDSLLSNTFDDDEMDRVYSHVKHCKCCRIKINCKLKKYYLDVAQKEYNKVKHKSNKLNKPNKPNKQLVNKNQLINNNSNKIFSYTKDELITVAIAVMFVVLLIDLVLRRT